MKQLRIVDGERWLACRDGWMPVPRDSILVGVIIGWHRPGKRRPAMASMSFDELR